MRDTVDADAVIEHLYATHYRSLVRLSTLLVGDRETAEDVVQDAFIATHGRWGRLREPEKALAYLRQAVVNRSRSVLRHRGVERRYAERLTTPPALAPDHERRAVVLAALQQLPERQREVLALRYYYDLDEAAIAETLGISRGTVKSHASRGAASLRTLLENR
ncbi:MAG: SigE family RNA polymerase sigma factor [Nocardioidaceae bacterium]|nr:MAG: SigE family RNA polymerase sigma factor [Nocardioidaceae bacterium]